MADPDTSIRIDLAREILRRNNNEASAIALYVTKYLLPVVLADGLSGWPDSLIAQVKDPDWWVGEIRRIANG